jgi:hypothetical protein
MEAKKHDHAQGEEVQSLQYGSNQCWRVIEFSPNFQSGCQLGYYTCTLDSSTLVILFSKMLEISKITFQITKYCQGIFHLLKWKFQN